jgi:uncharacterized protein YegL
MTEQIPFGTASFAENPEPRLPCILLVDTSGSMQGQPISELNSGLATYKDALAADALASKRVEVALVTFGGSVQTICDFTTIEQFHPSPLTASGDTPMGAAISHGLEMLRQRKEIYKASGISYFRPWMWLITDGGPTDSWQQAAEQIKLGDTDTTKSFSFFAVGVEGANFDILKKICVREPLRLNGLRFQDMFLWLSASHSGVSRSSPGDTVPLTNPAAPGGWANV